MKRSHLLLLPILLLMAACQGPDSGTHSTRPAGEDTLPPALIQDALTGTVDFPRHIKPVLEQKCLACHVSEAMPGKMDLSSREAAVASRTLGDLIVPHRPEKSLFLTQIRSNNSHLLAMPPVGEQLTENEFQLLSRWIQQGAHWPRGAAGKLSTP